MLALASQIIGVFETLDPATAYRGAYEPWLVATSLGIAILAAFVALSISARIVATTSRRARWAWASAGAVSMGGGIWSMHFIGMLAFSLPCGISYDPFGTVLSMIPGILASGVALSVISQTTGPNLKRLIIGAVLMGAGIGTMHYSGMAAMRPEALLRYDPMLVGVSVVVAVVLAFISLGLRFRLPQSGTLESFATLAAAVVMGCAVAGMHYTAMQASIFYPLSEHSIAGAGLHSTVMAVLIAIISILVATSTLVATFAGRKNELARSLEAEVARRKALEQDAEGGRARLQAIFDAVVDAIVTVDKRGRILQWSSGAQQIFGYTPEEVVGEDLTMLMPQPHRSRHHTYIGAFLRTREAKIIGTGRELTAIRKDGTEFPIELSVSEVRNGDEVFFTGILRDITERERAKTHLVRAREQAEAANLAKSQFLATMSHEIRTPMNGVLGMANLLAATSLNDRQARLVENLMRSGQALLAIINDILDFSKIEAGHFELFEIAFDPREAIAELTDLFSERCAEKGLEFVHFIDEGVPSQLVGDPVRLRQILINLVGNAIKFTEHGEILVELTLADGGSEDVMLKFSVEDTGIGIAPEQHARVFESFHQVDGSMTRSRGGSGLGLAITRQLVELMGGTIGIDSELGRGSRFSFTARLKRSAENAEPAPRAGSHIARPLRTLLVDANAVSAQVMSQYLASWKIDATVVSSASEAEAAWREAVAVERPFDVAILDVKGLAEAGTELARTMRLPTTGRPTELVLLVGVDNAIDDACLKQLGALACLTKPVRPSELFDCLTSVAAGSTQRGRLQPSARRSTRGQRPQFDAHILVVEDNPVNQEVAIGTLEIMGCRVVTAPNGRAAVRLFEQERFDLILMDCEMPVMDGLEAARCIRKIEATGASPEVGRSRPRTPIIALTAHALGEVRDSCLRAGMDDFLTKPFDERQMGDALRRWLVPRGSAESKDVAADEAVPATSEATVAAAPVGAPIFDAPAFDAPAFDAPAFGATVIDAAVIDSLRALDRNGTSARLERAVSRYLEIAPSLAETIRQKSEEGDAEALWRAAHSLKSSSGALGAKQLSQRCAAIETAARNSGIEQARPLVAGLDDDLAAATQGLQALIGTSRAA
jgi:two-component system sensor histidine kinase/response regulator